MSKIEKPKVERRKTASPARAPRAKALQIKSEGALTAGPVAETAAKSLDIAHRAFELYCERGGTHGHDVDDWLRAERELTAPAR